MSGTVGIVSEPEQTNANHSLQVNEQSEPNRAMFSLTTWDKYALVVIVSLALVKGLTWSLLVPPFYGFDEPMHFTYGRKIAQTHNLRVAPSVQIPLDIWELDMSAEKRTQLPQGVLPSERYVEDKEQIVATQPGFYSYHPPLYFSCVAAILGLMSSANVLWQILVVRLFSTVLGVVTSCCAFLIGKALWKNSSPLAPLATATLVLLQPMSSFSFGIVSNSAMEITLFSLLSLLMVRAVQNGLNGKIVSAISVLMCLGMFTKISFAAAAPLLVLLAGWNIAQRKHFKTNVNTVLRQLFVMIVPCVVLSLAWFSKAWQTGGDSLVRVFDEKGRRQPFTVLDYLTHYQWGDKYAKTVASYLGHFGWRDSALPVALMIVLLIVLVGGIIYTNGRAIRELVKGADFTTKARSFSILLLNAATVSLVLFYIALDMRVNAVLGGWFTIRGQYYLTAVIGQVLCVVLMLCWNRRSRLSGFSLVFSIATAVALNFYSLFAVVTQHCYGTSEFNQVCDMAASLQAVNPSVVATSIQLYFCVCIALLLFAASQLIAKTRTPAEE